MNVDVLSTNDALRQTAASVASSTFLCLVLLALLLGGSACNRQVSPDAAVSSSSATALVGQWRNVDGTWRFKDDGTFWFMGGTTIQMNPSNMGVPNLPRSEQFHGTYEIRGAKLHLTLKQRKPIERESTFRIDGRKLTIDGQVYDQQ